MIKNSRHAAIETLYQLSAGRLPLSTIFERIAAEGRLDARDRQLAKKIAYGVLRNRDYLDHLLQQLCAQPARKINPFIRQALLSGLYQLFFLDRIPPSAAVNETVNVVKAGGFSQHLQGFVNGVLRGSLRKKDQLPGPAGPGRDGLPWLNHPNWLTSRWAKRYGEQTMVDICLRNNLEPPVCLRLNSARAKNGLITKLEQQNISAIEGQYAPDALLLGDFSGPIQALPGFEEGLFQVQDQAPQLVSLMLAPFSDGARYLDCCAGLGGKTSHLALLLKDSVSSLSAIEPNPGRFALLEQTLQRTFGNHRVALYNETLQTFTDRNPERFDRILIDAPCSGTGVIGRQPDIRWNRDEKELAAFAGRQLDLLARAAELLTPGGVLVYATCSIEAEENEQVIERFLDQANDFSVSDARHILPVSARALVRDGFFAPLPAPGIDGFFAARLVKEPG